MKIKNKNSDALVLKSIGERLAQIRLAKNLTQEQVAEQAGLGLRTVQRLELGATATQLSGFIRVCRVLEVLENLDAFLPEPPDSPIERLKLQKRTRLRASGKKSPTTTKSNSWQWGE